LAIVFEVCMCLSQFARRPPKSTTSQQEFYRRGYKNITNGNEFTCLFKIQFQKNVNIYSLNVDVVNRKWKFIYLGRRPSPSPLLSPDVLDDVDVVDLKLSNMSRGVTLYLIKHMHACGII
jgi:hypothetical protein